ncbi:MAG: LysM peptidoglycan-binding domain-containing protein [Gammaproteobacteria bacterium]|nr:LysM peptidoglycan-binding domain-containing protein [Gammaproteobacteria bacterium]
MKIARTSGRSAAALLVSLALAGAATGLFAQQGGGIPLNPSHPDTYVVKRGDTLWDISSLFLRDPWYWPEIWYVNPQVENPHLIYPGDVLTLVYIDGKPQIQMSRGASGTDRLSPQIREEQLTAAVDTIPYEAIAPFLSKGMVLSKDEINGLPYIVALRDDHLVAASGNDAYVRGKLGGQQSAYSVVHIGKKLRDPDDGDVLGYEGVYVADGRISRTGDPATLELNNSQREALKGDRLIAQNDPLPLNFEPRAPDRPVEGRIVHVVDGVTQIGQYQVIVLNRGARHGLAPGHVLTVWQTGDKVADPLDTGLFNRKVQLPDERAGTLMVFKTYDRLSYALVMQAEGPIHTLDKVRNPG